MAIKANDLAVQVIRPTLDYLGMYTPHAEQILINTAAQLSEFDPFCRHGPGIGIYRISAAQHRCHWDDYLAFKTELASKVRGLASQRLFLLNPDHELATNLAYSTAIAWTMRLQTGVMSADSNVEQSVPVEPAEVCTAAINRAQHYACLM